MICVLIYKDKNYLSVRTASLPATVKLQFSTDQGELQSVLGYAESESSFRLSIT